VRDEYIELERRAPKLKRLDRNDWWRVGQYALTAIWALAFMTFTIDAYAELQDRSITLLWLWLLVLGCAAAITGRLSLHHLWAELPGLLLILGGLGVYVGLQVLSMVADDSLARLSLFTLALLVASPFVQRTLYLLGRLFVALGWRKDVVRLRTSPGVRW
jgi:hypothetical protein